VPQEIYGRAYGTCQSASSLGMALGPLVGATMSSAMGLRWPFAVMGGLLLVSSALVARFLRSGKPVPATIPSPGPVAVRRAP